MQSRGSSGFVFLLIGSCTVSVLFFSKTPTPTDMFVYTKLCVCCLQSGSTKVVLIETCDVRRQVFQHLIYRKDCRGRAVIAALPQLGLRKWDRLIPTKTLPNVANFEFLEPPFEACFWRMDRNGRVVHDCPILEQPATTGLSYDDWAADLLHSWALGPCSGLVRKTLMFVVKSEIFSPTSAYLDSEDRDRLAMLHVKTLVSKYYKEQKDTDPNWKRTGTEVGARYITNGFLGGTLNNLSEPPWTSRPARPWGRGDLDSPFLKPRAL